MKAGRAVYAVNNQLMQRADASVLAEGELTDHKLDHHRLQFHKDKKYELKSGAKILVTGEMTGKTMVYYLFLCFCSSDSRFCWL